MHMRCLLCVFSNYRNLHSAVHQPRPINPCSIPAAACYINAGSVNGAFLTPTLITLRELFHPASRFQPYLKSFPNKTEVGADAKNRGDTTFHRSATPCRPCMRFPPCLAARSPSPGRKSHLQRVPSHVPLTNMNSNHLGVRLLQVVNACNIPEKYWHLLEHDWLINFVKGWQDYLSASADRGTNTDAVGIGH